MEIRENNNPNIPDDVLIINILPRLPPKSLIRFKTVCKQWRSIISTPNFIESNLRLSKANDNNNGVLVRSKSKSLSRERVLTYISYDDFSTTDFHLDMSKIGISYPGFCPDYYVLGSCNGLQCCWLNVGRICVWNPITNECRQIPKLLAEYPWRCVFGFGYVPSLDDYKLVMLELSDVIHVHSYTLRSCDTKWKQHNVDYVDIDDRFSLGSTRLVYNYLCSGIILPNAKSHWLVTYNEDELIILGFDMETDTFKTVNPPEELIRVRKQMIRSAHGIFHTCLSSIKDNLCIAMTASVYGDVSGTLEVWKLLETSSWNKFLKFDGVESPENLCIFFTSYEFRKSVKLLTYSNMDVWSLYLKSKSKSKSRSKSDHQITQHEYFEVEPSLFSDYGASAVLYVESLVSPFMTMKS
ncbi:F-box/kelch-repeat protein At3g23880-like [Spinacia oleracea]|uniref:F-box/kelch-repeat protein At3g23880-like n=1 Tax=Spinacia oleracea TaxID=3562 RepID=A0ABM3RNB4_SPIOL|nr:F-box/kelch-repeat protein At3g23880-like [Spinacia oleracea]